MNAIRALYLGLLLGCSVIAKPENGTEDIGYESFISAIKKGDVAQVESMIKHGADINEGGDFDYTPLHISAGAGLERITKILIDNGAIIDAQDDDGETPLENAASYGNLQAHKREQMSCAINTAELLIKAGAKGSIRSKFYKETPLHVALQSGEFEVAQRLIEGGADVNAVMTVNITGFGIRSYTPLQRLLGNPYRPTRIMVELLIKSGADINAVSLDAIGYSPLNFAIDKESDDSVIDLLIEKGASVNHALKDSGRTPLHQAVANVRPNVVKSLIRAGAHINATDYRLNTPLHLVDTLYPSGFTPDPSPSTVDNMYAIAVLLIDSGADVNAKNGGRCKPFDEIDNKKVKKLLQEKMEEFIPVISAVKKNGVDRVVSLIKDGANVNEKEEENGFAPLHFSSGAGLERITKILIDNGANVHIRSNEGKTPLEIAAVNGHVQIAELLIEAGANVDATNDNGVAILFQILDAREDAIAEMLIENGAQVNTDHWQGSGVGNGYSPLHYVFGNVFDPSRKIIEYLIEHGANINAVSLDDVGATPLERAVIMAFDENLIDFLIEKGASVNHATKSGQTALHRAVERGRVKIVKSLISAGALVNATDKDLNTPLHSIKMMKLNHVRYFATVDDYTAICELLIANGADMDAKDADGKTPLDVITNEKIRKLLKEKMDQPVLNHIHK